MSLVQTSTGGDIIHVDQAAVLTAIGLNPRDPKAQAVVLVCDRYGLDPVLKHVILIKDQVYVTRDGLLHIAHSSGQLDGIEVVDEAETPQHWTAKVAVYRKDWTRPVTYSGRYPKTGSNKAHGPEMAIARAESMALRRAFAVAGLPSRDEVFDPDTAVEADAEPIAPEAMRDELRDRLNALPGPVRREYKQQFGTSLDLPLSRFAEAAQWVASHETSPSPPAGSAVQGSTQETTPPVSTPPADNANTEMVSKAQAQRAHVIATGLADNVLRPILWEGCNRTSDSASRLLRIHYDWTCQALEAVARNGELFDGFDQLQTDWSAWKTEQEATERALAQYEADMAGGTQ